MMSPFICFLTLLACANSGFGYPYRSHSLRSSSKPQLPPSLQEYLDSFSEGVPQYSDFNPAYQEGYLSQRPHSQKEIMSALLPLLNYQQNSPDYSSNYDYPMPYGDEEQAWYDEAAMPTSYDPDQAALLRLLLDDLAGKFSLEDLETLERQQAFLRDNTVDQLHDLRPKKMFLKKSSPPVFGSRLLRPSVKRLLPYDEFPFRGQKEEAALIPASRKSKILLSTQGPVASDAVPTTTANPSPVLQDIKSTENSSVKDSQNTTLEPQSQSAYEFLLNYLAKERDRRRKEDDEAFGHTQQKRFVTQEDSLKQQLTSLKKTIA